MQTRNMNKRHAQNDVQTQSDMAEHRSPAAALIGMGGTWWPAPPAFGNTNRAP